MQREEYVRRFGNDVIRNSTDDVSKHYYPVLPATRTARHRHRSAEFKGRSSILQKRVDMRMHHQSHELIPRFHDLPPSSDKWVGTVSTEYTDAGTRIEGSVCRSDHSAKALSPRRHPISSYLFSVLTRGILDIQDA